MPRPRVLLGFMLVLSLSSCGGGNPAASSAPLPIVLLGNVTARPSAAQLAWMAKEVGAMITFNLQSLCVSAGAANASAQACQVSSLRVPALPVNDSGICYYLWSDVFMGDMSWGRMNQFVPQVGATHGTRTSSKTTV